MMVTVFRSRLKPEAQQEYAQWAQRISALARQMPGYVSHKVFVAEDGERATIVEFDSEEAHQGWSAHAEHQEAKKKGRKDFYLEYKVQVCRLLRESTYPKK